MKNIYITITNSNWTKSLPKCQCIGVTHECGCKENVYNLPLGQTGVLIKRRVPNKTSAKQTVQGL